jgi:hypothetical protein
MATLSPHDPSYESRQAGVEQMRSGLNMVAAGTIQSLAETEFFTQAELARLVGYVEESFPTLIPNLSEATQAETIRELKMLSNMAHLAPFQERLSMLSAKLESAVAFVDPN